MCPISPDLLKIVLIARFYLVFVALLLTDGTASSKIPTVLDSPKRDNVASTAIMERIDTGLRKRSDAYIEELFKRHSSLDRATCALVMGRDNLACALQEYHALASGEASPVVTDELNRRCDTLLRTFDRNKDGRLDPAEFAAALRAPSPLEQWARALPLPQLLVDALPRRPPAADADADAALRFAGALSAEEIEDAVAGFAHGLRRILTEKLGRPASLPLNALLTHPGRLARLSCPAATAPSNLFPDSLSLSLSLSHSLSLSLPHMPARLPLRVLPQPARRLRHHRPGRRHRGGGCGGGQYGRWRRRRRRGLLQVPV